MLSEVNRETPGGFIAFDLLPFIVLIVICFILETLSWSDCNS